MRGFNDRALNTSRFRHFLPSRLPIFYDFLGVCVWSGKNQRQGSFTSSAKIYSTLILNSIRMFTENLRLLK